MIDYFRHSLADTNALPQITLVGAIMGVLASLLIVAFRLLIELSLESALPEHTENFEALPPVMHFSLPVIGACIIAICLTKIPRKYHQVGVSSVLERLHNFQGRMSFGNFLVQFFGGILCLVTGQSVGREGPAVHIGASAASLLGQWLKLTNNSLKILIGCGVAAAIAASFNTPIAGVIFAMEVVLMSYSVVGFIPILMASIIGAFISKLVFGDEFFFSVANFQMHGLWELPLMVVGGFIIGICAKIYMRVQLNCYRKFHQHSVLKRIIWAGLITGSLALIAPEILGLGYDTINTALMGQFTIDALIIILITKMIATGVSIGLGMPGGLIGPQLLIGACMGAILGIAINVLFPDSLNNHGLYVLLGMAAMMGAVINAPLAALMAILELTYNPEIIFPSLLIIVIACLTTRSLFRCEGIFIEQLIISGKHLQSTLPQQYLNNISVRTIMSTLLVKSAATIDQHATKTLLQDNPLWIIINHNNDYRLIESANLVAYLSDNKENTINLLEIPGKHFTISLIEERATLYEAQQALLESHLDALLITDTKNQQVIGIITQDAIHRCYE